MNNNYEMAAIISDALAIPRPGEKALDSIRVADRLAASGYRKPRTITSLEELKTVYEGAVLVDPRGDVWSIDGATGRLFSISDGNDETYGDDELPLPATVVYEGVDS